MKSAVWWEPKRILLRIKRVWTATDDHWQYSQVTSKICHVYFAVFYLIFYEWHYLNDQSLAQFGLGGQFATGLAVRMDDVLGGGLSCSAHCAADCTPINRCVCRYVTFEPTQITSILAIFTAWDRFAQEFCILVLKTIQFACMKELNYFGTGKLLLKTTQGLTLKWIKGIAVVFVVE